jgi:hypothetical protein
MSERSPLDGEQLPADFRTLREEEVPGPLTVADGHTLKIAESLEQLGELIDSERYALRVRRAGVVQEVRDGIAESLEQLGELIDSERYALHVRRVGVVQEVRDGIAIVSGLPDTMLD